MTYCDMTYLSQVMTDISHALHLFEILSVLGKHNPCPHSDFPTDKSNQVFSVLFQPTAITITKNR